jgi:LuxR family maltose regulon positive regulatory protein
MSALEIAVSKTKVIIPKRRVELLTRQRLLDALYEILDRKLVLISAPAGYGKTSLLIDMASHVELPTCWLALDSLDRDPQRFIAYFIAAITEQFPTFGKRSRSALKALTDLETGMESVLVTLINEIYDEIHEHFIVVLDDFHLVDEVNPIVNFVNRFIQLADENCHLILSSRSLSNLPDLTLLVAREQVSGLGFSDLIFQPEEIQSLLAQNQQIHLSDDEARQLAEATEGWVTGLQFTDLNMIQGGVVKHISPSAGVNVFDYLGKQALENQPEALQLFLLRSSLLEEFDAALCESVLAAFYATRQDWSQFIELILQKNLFVLPVGANGQWLRYHHLFRDFLQERFRKEYPDEAPVIVKRLAEFYEGRGEWEKAYQFYKQLGDGDALVNMIEHAGIPMYQHALLTLDVWIRELPLALSRKQPGLLSLRGAVEIAKNNLLEGVDLLTRAMALFRNTQNTSDLALALVRRGNAFRLLGNYDDAVHDADEAIEITNENSDLQWIFADALRIKGLVLFRQGQTIHSMRYLEQALDIYARLEDVPAMAQALVEAGVAYAETGEYLKGLNCYQKALAIWRQTGNLSFQAIALNNLGFLYQRKGDYEHAAETLEEGLLCARSSNNKYGEALILISLGDLYAELEDFEIAEQNYRKAKIIAEQLNTEFLINYLNLAEFNLALLRKDVEQAGILAEKCSDTIKAEKSNYEFGLYQLLQAKLFLLQAKYRRTMDALKTAQQCFNRDGRQTEYISACIWMAAAQCKLGKPARALKEMSGIITEPNGLNHTAILTTYQARPWLEELRTDKEARQTLRNLFKRSDDFGNQLHRVQRQLHRLARAIEIPSPKLMIHALGLGYVQVNGKVLTLTDWQTRSVRELFFYFLSLDRPANKEQIAEALWTETTDSVSLNLRFKNEIYRLRRALGNNVILFEENRYRFNSESDHDYDVEAFEAFLNKAKSSSAPKEQITLYERALDLVGGYYLEDFDAIWVLPERERLKQAYLEAALALGELYLKDGQNPKALRTCDKALEYDVTAEAVYCLKMQVFHRLGDRGSVIDTYRTCEQVMQDTYRLPPSKETQELFRKLTSL